jgi:hypothetical protein
LKRLSALAERPFNAAEFPYLFLQAFGNKETTLKRLRKGESNKSDLGGVLQANNIHIAVAEPGAVTKSLAALKASPATGKAKAKFWRRTVTRSRPKTSRAVTPSPAHTGTSPTILVSSCRLLVSRPSRRFVKAPSTSGRPAA